MNRITPYLLLVVCLLSSIYEGLPIQVFVRTLQRHLSSERDSHLSLDLCLSVAPSEEVHHLRQCGLRSAIPSANKANLLQ